MSPNASTDETGSRARLQAAVGDAYEIRRLLGRGGFAEVFEAHDPALHRSVAVKVLRPDVASSPMVVERFQREARALARLRHPHVIEVYAVGERDGVAYYVMPLIHGDTLAQRVEREGPLDPAEAERILMEAAAGLGAAHRAGIVHRDVKPENILLDGEERRVVLTDFGIARGVEDQEARLTGTRMVVGSPRYLSPEQAAGDPVDHRADLYALGVVGYYMVAGRPPFEAPTAQALMAKHLSEAPTPLASVRPGCPDGVARVVDRCLQKEPGRRWPDAPALIAALRDGCEGRDEPVEEPGVAHPEPPDPDRAMPGAASRSAHRRRLVAAAAVGAGAVVLEGALVGTLAFSLPVALVAGAVAVASTGAARRDGHGLRDLFRSAAAPGPAPESDSGAFGRHADVVRESRSCRGHILRLFHTLSRAERERFPDLLEAVDSVALGIKQDARRLATLEEREESDRAGTAASSRAGMVPGEIAEARERILGDLNEEVEALEQIRHWLARSGGADSAAVHDQLLHAVERAKTAARGRTV